jgi:parallel beta-helix repeat protein
VSTGSGLLNYIRNILIENNSVSKFDQAGILVVTETEGDSVEMDNIVLSNNKVTGDTKSEAATASVGIAIQANSPTSKIRNITILNNTVRQIPLNPGIGIYNSSLSPDAVKLQSIEGNQALHNGFGIAIGDQVYGDGVAAIKGNSANRNSFDGIVVEGVNFLLSNNKANDNARYGIFALGNIDGGGNTAVRNGDCNTPGCY